MRANELNGRIAQFIGAKPDKTYWYASNDGGKSMWMDCEHKSDLERYLQHHKEDYPGGRAETATVHQGIIWPRYAEDRNVMAKAEQNVRPDLMSEYMEAVTTERLGKGMWRNHLMTATGIEAFMITTSPAKVRAIAFARTMKLIGPDEHLE